MRASCEKKVEPWFAAFDLLAVLLDDFNLTAAEREKDRPQKRKGL
jgi:hypothetical protein